MGETTEQSKASDVHKEPVDLISENPDDPKGENVMAKLLAEMASLKEKVNSMGQNGQKLPQRGKTVMSHQQVKVTTESRPKMGTLNPKIPEG